MDSKENLLLSTEQNEENTSDCKTDLTVYIEGDYKKPHKPKKQKQKDTTKYDADFSGFYALAELMNMSIDEALDKCCMFQVKNLMSKMGKVIVRYNVSNDEIAKILFNTSALGVSETLFAPAYLQSCKNEINRNPELNQKIGVIIDFPFGEGEFKSKCVGIKESIKEGVDSVTVMIPLLLLDKDRVNELKKQLKKISKFRGVERGIAVSCAELNEGQIKLLSKMTDRYKLSFITLVFGNVSEDELIEKVGVFSKYKGKKQLKVLANVDSARGITELFKLNTDVILTPYADEIGKELIERFKIKSLKLK